MWQTLAFTHKSKREIVLTTASSGIIDDMNPHGTKADLGSSRIKPCWKIQKID